MQAMQKKLRVEKLNLARLRDLMSELVKTTMDIENLSKLEACVADYRLHKTTYESNVEQFILSLDDSSESYDALVEAQMKDVNRFADVLFTYEGKIKAFHKKLSTAEARDSLVPSDLNQSFRIGNTYQPKLEKIQIPVFDGEILNFNNFKGLFENLVHNNPDISNVQKLYYLKQALTGAAREIIRDFELKDSSYPEAWSYVVNRYDNKRAVIRALFRNLLNLESIKHESKIRSILDQTDVIIRSLKANGEEINDTFSRFIAYLVGSRLDPQTCKDWENSITTCSSFPKYRDLQKFLQIRSFTVEDKAEKSEKTEKPKLPTKKSFAVTSNSCIACNKGNHLLIRCAGFASKTPKQRLDLILHNRMCTNCFGKGHFSKSCTNGRTCKVCAGKHNTLLHLPETQSSTNHPNNAPSQPPATPTTEINAPEVSVNVFHKPEIERKVVLLPTAVVRILGNGIPKTARVLLDSCSQVTMISEEYVKKNGLPVSPSMSQQVKGIGNNSLSLIHSCSFSVISRYDQSEIFVTASVAPQSALSYRIEGLSVPQQTLQQFRNFELADPSYYVSPIEQPKIDVLIGADYFEACFNDERATIDSLTLRSSKFGWVVSGAMQASQSFLINTATRKQPLFTFSTFEIERQLRMFWEVEEAKPIQREQSDEKEICVRHFDETFSRAPNGQFIVRLPTRESPTSLSDNRELAFHNLYRTEKVRPVEIRQDYIKFMQEYEQLGHMTQINTVPETPTSYYIPHQAVLRPSSTTTALRVVFNASFKTQTGKSLNDILMTGPNIQPELFDTLLTFREHTVAITADISKMYRGVLVHPDDRHLQRILWRENSYDAVRTFELNTVTYGTAPASFLATNCLKKIAESQVNPAVAHAISNQFYMDDLLTGAPTVEQATQLCTLIHNALKSAGFNLRKYRSNSPIFLNNIEPSLNAKQTPMSSNDTLTEPVLGLDWITSSDCFRLKVHKPKLNTTRLTKRTILSEISKTFDPLSFASPVTIRAKLMLQRIWKESLTWDQLISDELASEFYTYWNELDNLEQFFVPRPYSTLCGPISRELFAFCDASEKAYAVVTYLKSIASNGAVSVNLVAAKTRVAPLKAVTIPRLELEGALLLANLVQRLSKILSVDIERVHAFSDSQVTLAWLAKSPDNWKTYVANRVRKITQILPYQQWSYVHTKENPADLATRGIPVSALLVSKLWLEGPKFIFGEFRNDLPIEDTELERRKQKVNCLSIFDASFTDVIDRFSSYMRLIRAFAYVLRFINNHRVQQLNHHTSKTLTAKELKYAEVAILRLVQRQLYAKDIDCLSNSRPLPKKSPILSLHPFLDENKILRVGGRLCNANLSFDRKHPIILHAKAHFVSLFIRYIHDKYYHCGKKFLVSFLRAKYWISGNLTNAVKKVIRSCVTCIRFRAAPSTQLMGNLPAERVNPSRPFTHTGIDFAGPIMTKCVGHRSKIAFKSYIAIFVCFATKASHLEVVSQLTTDHFLSALSRFIARRGKPASISSDNGTNFVGAANYLDLTDTKISDTSANDGITWKFNAPRAPHRGGIWESAVKAMKYHLVRCTHGLILTFEELTTVICRIESIMNSRPIIAVGDSYLTPGHFLIGDQMLSEPNPTVSNEKLARRYETYLRIIDSFWKTWRKDYLAQLQTRNKWKTTKPNITPNTVVLLKDDLVKPNQWKYGVISAVYPDRENVIRTVDVRTESTIKRRAINSIIPLVESDEPPVHPGGVC